MQDKKRRLEAMVAVPSNTPFLMRDVFQVGRAEL